MRVKREGMFQLLPYIRNLHVFRHTFKCYRNSLRKVSHNGMKVGTRIPLHSSHWQMCACIKQLCNKCLCVFRCTVKSCLYKIITAFCTLPVKVKTEISARCLAKKICSLSIFFTWAICYCCFLFSFSVKGLRK